MICFYVRSAIAVISCAAGFILSIHFGNLRKLYPVIHHCVTFAVCLAVSIREDAVSKEGELVIVSILAVTLVLSEIYSCAQKVTVFGGLIRNPFWSNFKARQRMSCGSVTHLVLQGALIHTGEYRSPSNDLETKTQASYSRLSVHVSLLIETLDQDGAKRQTTMALNTNTPRWAFSHRSRCTHFYGEYEKTWPQRVQSHICIPVCPPMMCWILTGGNFYEGTALRRLLVAVSLIKAEREVSYRS